jgi:iron complex outermembrane recepter protein
MHQPSWATSAFALLIIGMAAVAPVRADGEVRHFDVKAGPARVTLVEFGRQAHREVFVDNEKLGDVRTQPLQGDFEPEEGLRRLLDGTGLRFKLTRSQVIVVTVDTTAVKPTTGDQRSSHPPTPETTSPSPSEAARVLNEVRVRAARGRGDLKKLIGTTPETFWNDDPEMRPYATTGEFIATLPENWGGGATEDTHTGPEAQSNTSFATSANLRGLGSRATLVLVNGRRLAPSGASGAFTDVSSIPMSAVDHTQIQPDGVATLYGSDAVGGVIDFVLRGSSERPESHASVGGVMSGSLGEKLLSQSYSRQGDRASGLIAVELYQRDALAASARKQATSDLEPQGGTNFDIAAGDPGTIVDAHNQTWAVPAGLAPGSLSSVALTAGTQHSYDRYQDTTILPEQRRFSLLATGQYQLGEGSSLFADVLASQRRVDSQALAVTTTLAVPGNNPYRVVPDGYTALAGDDSVDVLYGFGKVLGPLKTQGVVTSGQAAVGYTREVPSGWSLTGFLGYALEYERDKEENLVNFAAVQSALAGMPTAGMSAAGTLGGATAAATPPATGPFFDPFADPAYLDPTMRESFRETGRIRYDSSYAYGNFSASHPLAALGGGPLVLTLGTDVRGQFFSAEVSPSEIAVAPAVDRSRSTLALFSEIEAPLWGRIVDGVRRPELGLSAGLRYEHFRDVGEALTPQLGLSYSPRPGWRLEGTWAKLYRAPDLPDLTEAVNLSAAFLLPDTHSSTGMTNALVWIGGNQDLKPESAKAWNLALRYAPDANPELSASLGFFHIVFANRIRETQDLPVDVLSNPQYASLIDRNVTQSLREAVCSRSTFIGLPQDCLNAPIGAVVDLRMRNLESLSTDGFDLRGHYGREAGGGMLRLKLAGTYILHYREQDSSTSPVLELRNTPHYPLNLRVSGSVSWEARRFSSSLSVNFQNAYRDPVADRGVSSWTTLDGSVGFTTLRGSLPGDTQSEIFLSGLNLLNRSPPFLNNSLTAIGYDPENGALDGRRISINLRHRW